MKNATRLTFCLLLTCATLLARPCAAAPGEWDYTNSLNSARQYHTATLLPSGLVLVAAGGSDENGSSVTAELYDPATGVWSFTGSLTGQRNNHTATLLPNGMVLVAGGYDTTFGGGVLATCELYNPATGLWSPTGSLHYARSGHKAILLNNGKVLAIGAGGPVDTLSCELYDPATGTWTITGSLNAGRRIRHSATLLLDGRVLVAGGGFGDYIASAELYDPATGKWTLTGSMHDTRSYHTATLLPSGKVLVAGGENLSGALASAELYDPASGTWTSTGNLNTGRTEHTATLLPNGQVLVAAGLSSTHLTSAELYDPATGTWSNTGSLNQARFLHTATLLPDGTVLAVGGQGSGVFALNTAEIYGSLISPPSNVRGRGGFDNMGNPVTFQFQASQSDDQYIGFLSICDAAADVCTKRGRVSSLTITGNTADFSGFVQLHGQSVNFDASVTDNSGSGSPDTFSITMTNGYSASGTLTSGDILLY
jgi:hypothetical protein